jgi:predicted transcriptional regulator
MKNTVLETMKNAGKPLRASDIMTLSGLDKKSVDKALTDLKKENAIVSPIRCFWQPA